MNGTEGFGTIENCFEEAVRNVLGGSVYVVVVRTIGKAIRQNELEVVDKRRTIIGERQHVGTEG